MLVPGIPQSVRLMRDGHTGFRLWRLRRLAAAIFLALGTWPMISIGDSPSGGGEARGIPRVAKGQGRG